MEKPIKVLFLPMLLVLFLTASAAGQVTLSVSKRSAQKIRTAVPAFAATENAALAAELNEILSNDLQMSGTFSILPDKNAVEELARQDRNVGQVIYSNWKKRGVELLVICEMSTSGNTIELSCEAYSISEGSSFFSKSYRREAGEKRELMHQVSDDILKKVTGEEGLGQSKIAFVSNRSGLQQIYVVGWDGRNLVQLTNGRNIVLNPKWSPDGGRILCTDYSAGSPHIALLDLVRGNKRTVSDRPGLNAFGRFSPDGKRIALTLSMDGNPEIYVCRADGSGLKRLTRTKGVESSPCWTPDGDQIVYVSDRSGSPQIYRMAADGSGDERLTYAGSYNTSPEVSPKGRLLSYCTMQGGKFQICLLDMETKETMQVTSDGKSNEDPTWGPSGRHLAYAGSDGGETDIYIIDIYDRDPLRLTKNLGNCTSPSWSR